MSLFAFFLADELSYDQCGGLTATDGTMFGGLFLRAACFEFLSGILVGVINHVVGPVKLFLLFVDVVILEGRCGGGHGGGGAK